MDGIRIKNVRSIVDSGDIELRKINILLGRNSSGKSSFLRLFPMLKESARNELRGPILWFDENYDFGGFANTLSRHVSEKDGMMRLEFSWFPSNRGMMSRYYYGTRSIVDSIMENVKNINVILGIGKHHEDVALEELIINLDDFKVCIKQSKENNKLELEVNEKSITTFGLEWDYSSASLLPKLHITDDTTIYDTLILALKNLYGNSIIERHMFFRIPQMIKVDDEAVWNYVEEEYLKGKKPRKIRVVENSNEYKKKVEDSIYLMHVNTLLHYIDDNISEYFKHTYYITPLRYNFQRYMRNRDLAVEYIESTGKNVMEYILSLKKTERENYIKYIHDTLGIEVEVEGKDNKSIFIKTEDGEKDNIVDVGYGYSQVLPIATTLWDRAYKNEQADYENTIVIEQPEVHLHPAMQRKLALLFVEALRIAKSRKKILKLIIETHSQPLIERLGKFVANGNPPEVEELAEFYKTDENSDVKMDEKDIAVYLFNKKDGVTTIEKTKYDKMGRIENWPIGFLD